jgi:hypothetical protein
MFEAVRSEVETIAFSCLSVKHIALSFCGYLLHFGCNSVSAHERIINGQDNIHGRDARAALGLYENTET